MDELYASPPSEWPSALKVASSHFDPEATAVVLLNPAVINKLSNKECIKLCGNGTLRLTQDEWVVMTLGVVTKHYAKSNCICAFRSTYTPLLFAVANTESCATYPRACAACSF